MEEDDEVLKEFEDESSDKSGDKDHNTEDSE